MRKKRKRRWRSHTQLTLPKRRARGRRGGWRPGAGRPRKPGFVSHAARPRLAKSSPQHVTLRIVEGLPSLATAYLFAIITQAIADSHKPWFRVVEFNVLGNHLHLMTEADDNATLARGMQGLEVRLARRLNRALGRRGKLFPQRFHARFLKTPTEVRNCLRYVLLNGKHHDAEKTFSKTWIDPWSSAPWFDGWAEPIADDASWKRDLVRKARPTAPAKTWLLRVGWRRAGPPLRFDERPA